MATSPVGESQPRNWHRWYRFSLRTMLVLTTALSVAMGYACSSAKRQQRAVEAIESMGGRVAYDLKWDGATKQWRSDSMPLCPVWLRKLLGRHYFDTVTSVQIWNQDPQRNQKKFASEYGPLKEFPHLSELSVGYFSLDDAEFGMIGQLTNLETLHLGNTDIPCHGAARMTSLKKLRQLGLDEVTISPEAIAEFKKLPNLDTFTLVCRHMDFRQPGNFPSWVPQKYSIGDDAIPAFLEFPRLHCLGLYFTVISDDGVALLSRLPQLEALGISSPQITNTSIAHVTKLTNLKSLGLEACQIHGESIEGLGALPKLTRLSISGGELDNDSLLHFASLNRLKSLDVNGKNVNDAGLDHLYGMTNLSSLDLQGTAVTADGKAVKELQRALPNLHIHQYHPTNNFR